MRKADEYARVAEFPPHEHKVLVGVRRINGPDLLLAKFAWRKNMKRGCILRRPCLCSDITPMSRALCPVRQIWPRISSRTRAGDLISLSFSAGRFGSKLKPTLLEVGFRYGGRFPPHCFRRGATQEIKTSCSGDTQIKGAGCWRGMGFRAYADTQMTDALKISRLVDTAALSDSEDDPDTPSNIAFAESPRGKAAALSGERTQPLTIDIDFGYRIQWVFNISGSTADRDI